MKLTIFSGILLLSLVGPFSQAGTITINSVSGVTRSVLTPTVNGAVTTTTPQIFAGTSGVLTATCDSTTTGTTCPTCCNTCAKPAGPLYACNLNAVLDSTLLTINFTAPTGSGVAALYEGGSVTTAAIPGTTVAYTAGSIGTIQISWLNFCSNTSTNFDCSSGKANESFTLAVSPSLGTAATDSTVIQFKVSSFDTTPPPGAASISDGTDGVGDFTVFPGDEKVYVTALSPTNLSGSGFVITDVVAFYNDFGANQDQTALTAASLTSVANSSNNFQMALNSTGQLIDQRVTGLTNGDLYAFRFAIQDDSGNIGYFTDDPGTPGYSFDYTKHASIPQQVFGLLEKNQNCFITTAAYGSPLDAHVTTFKKFRDQVLKQYSLGRAFVDFYYDHSPKWADKIRQSETARAVTRFFLWPLWAMAVISLKIGFWTFMGLLFSAILSLVLLKKKFFQLKHFLIFAFIFLSFQKTHGQEDNYFDLQDDTATKPTQEAAPQEPPYTGTENDEFKDVQSAEEKPAPKSESQESADHPKTVKEENEEKQTAEFQENFNAGDVKQNSNKWKPYSRVPEETELKNLADQGLFKITKKGEYLYQEPVGPQNQAASIRFGVASFPNLHNSGANGQVIKFQDIYGTGQKPMLFGDYEWQFFKSAGKLALKFGSGLMIASGNGRFAQFVPTPPAGSNNQTNQAMEKYNFFMFPNSLSAIYRLDIFPHQWFVPFAEGGADYFTFFELRDDAKGFKFGGSPLAHFAVGGSFLLDVIDKEAISGANREYGVSHMWLTAEYRRFQNLGAQYDFSDNIFDAGVMFEF